MSGFTVSVLYPNESDANFKLDYYLSSHMPMVLEQWGKYGLKSWEVVKVGPGPDGSASQYSIQALLNFKDVDSFKGALGSSEASTVLGDIPNFSNKQPVFVTGEVVGKS